MWNNDLLSDALGKKLGHSFTAGKIDFDSRNIKQGDIFIALAGGESDGADYALDAYKNGASYIILRKKIAEIEPDRQIIVDDTYELLLRLAKYKRSVFTGNIIAITGSVGKTTSKDLCSFLFAKIARTYASYGNYNNHIGMPLCLANLDLSAEFAFFELGMNHLGEIRFLTNILSPNIALITKISDAHIGHFADISGIIEAKSEIVEGLTANGKLLLNSSDKNFPALFKFITDKYQLAKENILLVSDQPKLESFEPDNQLIEFISKKYLSDFRLQIDFKDAADIARQFVMPSFKSALIVNFLMVFTLFEHFSKDYTPLLAEAKDYDLTQGRGLVSKVNYQGKNILLIDESYNSSPEAVRSLLADLVAYCELYPKKITFFMGEMLEMGDLSSQLHLELAENIQQAKIQQFIAIGDKIESLYKKLRDSQISCYYYKKVEELLAKLYTHIADDEIVIVKGSRGVKTDLIVKTLEGKLNVA